MSASIQPAPTATATIVSGAAAAFPISLGYYPQEGSRAISAQYNWTAQAAYAEDLSQLSARGMETTIQGIYVDNSLCSSPVTILIGTSGQVIICPGNAQGAFPAMFSGAQGYQISVPGVVSGVTRLMLVNVPLNSSGIWTTIAAGGSSGTYLAAPPELTTGASSTLLLDPYGGLYVNGESNAPTFSATAQFTAAAGATDICTLSAPLGGKTVRVHLVNFQMVAGAGTLVLLKRFSANTGGTPGTFPAQAHSPGNTTASVVTSYASNPSTLGNTNNSIIEADMLSATAPTNVTYRYGEYDQSIVLTSGVTLTQSLCLNLQSSNPSGQVIVKFKWSEI